MAYRIIQWGTGNVGKHGLRLIVERPDFELAGVRVYNPDKVGLDAGDLLGVSSTGILATDDVDAILALDADCVAYSPLGGVLDGGTQALDDITRLLESGKNVVSSAVEEHAYFRPDIRLKKAEGAEERLAEACRKGGTSFFHIGINPGFTMDAWPISLSRLCRRIDHMRVTEIVDMSRYDSAHMVRTVIGFGLSPDAPSPIDAGMGDVYQCPFYLCLRMIADSIGVTLDDVRYSRETAVTDHPLEIAVGTIEAGTVAATKFQLEGILNGRPIITLEWVWRVNDEVAPEWPNGDARWLLHIDGDPAMKSEIVLTTNEDANRATSLAVATLVANAIPTVCRAEPGVLDNLVLPPHGGGYFLP